MPDVRQPAQDAGAAQEISTRKVHAMNWKLLAQSLIISMLVVGYLVFHGIMCVAMLRWYGYTAATLYNMAGMCFPAITGAVYTIAYIAKKIL